MSFIKKVFKERVYDKRVITDARKFGLTPQQARVVAGRATGHTDLLEDILFPSLKKLHHPELLKDGKKAAEHIAHAVIQGQRIGILTDYDVDGICSHVVIYEALCKFSAPPDTLSNLIGHRMNDGYGVSEKLVDRILSMEHRPQLIITADCGSSDEQQLKRLKEAGIGVVVTDHHAIPEEGVPASALATVNPTRNDCPYPDKFMSGCMVSWLVMCLVRNLLIEQGFLAINTEKLGNMLDYVALSTVADAVSLFSPTNRAVVRSGLDIINSLKKPCWFALAGLIRKGEGEEISAQDLAFQFAPRINARSRMADPYAALNFFLSKSICQAGDKLKSLEKSNDERKYAEREMVNRANRYAHEQHSLQKASLVITDDDFHPGVQGIVASRLVDSFGKPAIVLSPVNDNGVLSGSARSIPGVHIRDLLQRVDEKHPKLLLSFGGHMGAAGLKIKKEDFDVFCQAFEDVTKDEIGNKRLMPYVLTDGILDISSINDGFIAEIQELEPFGREFEEPLYEGIFAVTRSRIVGSGDPVHLSMRLEKEGQEFNAIWFRALENPDDKMPIRSGNTARCAYKLKSNFFRGRKSVQLVIEYAEVVIM
ncbi:MAG: single-stranded-DNA-specific exonuclease RecJ [Desulfobulbaceae bacterium]|nr:single-stranded-DNA-specific exonuclease RecJ [Desulfobulbaceae bacterium]